jgi:hypothetical protein
VDSFKARGLKCFGPGRKQAQLEGSKAFTKDFLKRHGIPTAASMTFTSETFDPQYVQKQRTPIVVKASGLAAGKGVVICDSASDAIETARSMFDGQFGDAGTEVVRRRRAHLDVRRQPEHELARRPAPGARAGPAGAEVVAEEDHLAGTGEPVPAATGTGGHLDVDLGFLVGTRQRSVHTSHPIEPRAASIDGAG